MKKFLTKIVLFSFTAIVMNFALNSFSAFAEGEDFEIFDEIATALDDAAESQCINEFGENDETPGPDAGYIITIQEEALPIDEAVIAEEKPGDDYIVRRCYRNTLQYIDLLDKELQTDYVLSTKCSEDGFNVAEKYWASTFEPKFACREVQVILSKGGTTMLYGYIGTIYRFGASMVGIIAVTVIIVSGIQISASGGDQEAIGKGKGRILKSILGIVVLFLSGLILYTVNPNFFVR